MSVVNVWCVVCGVWCAVCACVAPLAPACERVRQAIARARSQGSIVALPPVLVEIEELELETKSNPNAQELEHETNSNTHAQATRRIKIIFPDTMP